MYKSKKRTNLKKLHTSYIYIIFFCAVFATFNFFIQKIAYKNEGKNYSQVQNMRFNQTQSNKFNQGIEESIKINAQNDSSNYSVAEKKKNFIANIFPILHKPNQDIFVKKKYFF